LPKEKIDWGNLRRLYEFESSRVSGPGSYKRDVNDVMWTLGELQSALSLSPDEVKEFERLISQLSQKRGIMKVPGQNGYDKYVTRTAEIVRLLGHNYEYWYRGRQSIDSVRWLTEDKKIPNRDITAEGFIEDLVTMVTVEIGDGPATLNLRTAIGLVVKGIATYFEPKDWTQARFSEFQLKSSKEMILSQFKLGYQHRAQILTAGVGSGKTIAFSIGMLVSAVEGILGGEGQRRCHLFLYPRKALAQDQYHKLEDVVKNIGIPQLQVHFEHYSYYASVGKSVKGGVAMVYGGFGPAPDLIVMTLETINRRLQHPLVIGKLSKYLKRVVLDEIHLVEGVSGCHVIRLLDRLRQACYPNDILWTGSSATVADPDLHAATVFGIEQRNEVIVIEPNSENLATEGLVHHVFMRPSGQLSSLGTLINSTSILVHNRRDCIWDRVGSSYPKTIGFADSLDLLGRWNSDFKENERTEYALDRPHPNMRNQLDWKPRQRELPYALRFLESFERRINVSGGKPDSEAYESVLERLRKEKICERCRRGERVSFGACTGQELSMLGRFVYRWPHKKDDNVKAFHIHNKIFEAGQTEIGTLDLCPYLRAGACFWFSQDDLDLEEIKSAEPKLYEWRSIARSKIHSSKTKSNEEVDDDLSELVFSATMDEVYDLRSGQKIKIDIVFASPSLEVGVDLPKVTESIMFKAIRNVASYRQKVGRIGREAESDIMNVNLLSLRPIDLHYYRQPRKLTSIARLDPVPLKEHNDSILRCALYMAVWDCLALRCNLPEVIPTGGLSETETDFTTGLRFSKDFLTKHRDEVARYLSGIAWPKYGSNHAIIQEAINQVSDEIDVFLTSTKGTIEDSSISCISDMVVHALNRHSSRIQAPKQSHHLNNVRDGEGQYQLFRPAINPILLGLSQEFQDLDCFNESGWIDIKRLEEISSSIDATLKKIDESAADSSETYDALRKINTRAIQDIISGLKGMEKSGENPLVVYFWQQFNKFRNESQFGCYYLSYTVQGMPIFNALKRRRHRDYTRPPNLFTNPYEDAVLLQTKGEVDSNILVSEALFGYIPGTWTFRQGTYFKKTLVGKLDSSQGGVLTAFLDRMESIGNEFDKIKTNVPAPPDFPGSHLDIYTPRKLALLNPRGKYVRLNAGRGTIFDGDEDLTKESKEAPPSDEEYDTSANNKKIPDRIKIPVSYLNRGVYIIADEGKRVLVNELDESNLIIEGKKEIRGSSARNEILHPMLKRLVENIEWHENLEVYDYVYSVSRSYSSKIVNEATLMFRDNQGDIAIGRHYITEGVSIRLNPEVVNATVSRIKNEMLNYENKWAPSMIKAFAAYLGSVRLPDGAPISPFMISDLLGVLITSVSMDFDCKMIYELPRTLDDMIKNEEKLREAAQKYYKGKRFMGLEEEESWISELSEQDMQDVKRYADTLVNFIAQLKGITPELNEMLEKWIIHTLLNTFGVAALSALQRLCGSDEEIIGYTVDFDAISKGEYQIFLYDRTHYGNGSCDVLRRYLHILNIQRHKQTDESRLLPSEDYLTLLEQELLQCPQFHTDMDALERFSQKQQGRQTFGLQELGYVGEYSEEVLQVCDKTWKQLGIRGREDAWKLPIISLAPGSFAQQKGIEVDDVIRATAICWNGCPECVVNKGAMIGAEGMSFIDKAILDEWFKIARESAQEYKTISINDIAAGKSNVEIGMQSMVCLELPNRRIRSISLPFTIGLELERGKTLPHAQLIIRDDDVQGFRAFGESKGSAHGLESLGFKRIMWYNLTTAAYLDLLGLLKKERKEIAFVFYDCRDVTFDDVGTSPRMIQAIEYHCKKAGVKGEISKLSDILAWLARQGFNVSLCVDESRCREEGVREFLERLAETGMNNISIRVKKLEGSMHKKALITPVGVIQGSANLTYSGTGLNEEIINYAPFGVREYEEMKINISDTFHGSEKWEPK
jgi:superfamily II DNA or RNA helicase